MSNVRCESTWVTVRRGAHATELVEGLLESSGRGVVERDQSIHVADNDGAINVIIDKAGNETASDSDL